MAEQAALQRLMTWLSPAFPVGAFAYSAGLETAILKGTVTDAMTMQDWLKASLLHGAARTDAILFAHAHKAHAETAALAALADLCLALSPASERVAELMTTGATFIEAARAWPAPSYAHLPDPCPYPVAVGAVAGAHAIDSESALTAFLTAYAHAQVSVALRLVPLGQSDGLKILAALEPIVAELARGTTGTPLSQIGSISYAADIAAMAHETLNSRVFRS